MVLNRGGGWKVLRMMLFRTNEQMSAGSCSIIMRSGSGGAAAVAVAMAGRSTTATGDERVTGMYVRIADQGWSRGSVCIIIIIIMKLSLSTSVGVQPTNQPTSIYHVPFISSHRSRRRRFSSSHHIILPIDKWEAFVCCVAG